MAEGGGGMSTVTYKPCACCHPDSCPYCGGTNPPGDAIYVSVDCGSVCSIIGGSNIQGDGATNFWSRGFVGGGVNVFCSSSPTEGAYLVYRLRDTFLGDVGPFSLQHAYFVQCGDGTAENPFIAKFEQIEGWDVCNGIFPPPGTPTVGCVLTVTDYHPEGDCLQAAWGTSDRTFYIPGGPFTGTYTAFYNATLDRWEATIGGGVFAWYFERGFVWMLKTSTGQLQVSIFQDCASASFEAGPFFGFSFDYAVLS